MKLMKAKEIGHVNELHFYNTIAATVAFTMFIQNAHTLKVLPESSHLAMCLPHTTIFNLVDQCHDLLLKKSRYL